MGTAQDFVVIEEEDVIVCGGCGTENDDDAEYCKECGSVIVLEDDDEDEE